MTTNVVTTRTGSPLDAMTVKGWEASREEGGSCSTGSCVATGLALAAKVAALGKGLEKTR